MLLKSKGALRFFEDEGFCANLFTIVTLQRVCTAQNTAWAKLGLNMRTAFQCRALGIFMDETIFKMFTASREN